MSTRIRGITALLAAIIGIIVTVIDGAGDGFSLWNGVAIACFAVTGAYGVVYITRPGDA
ncbi:MAG: hypothetical protein ABW122_01850 [Ilumatobacteraceae bacterium]